MYESCPSHDPSNFPGMSNVTTPNNQSEPVPVSPVPAATSVADDLRNLNNQVRAKIVSDALKKGAIGAMTGAAFSFLIFKRKQAHISIIYLIS